MPRNAVQIAAMCGVGIACALALIFHLAPLGWVLGLISGWVLCAVVQREK
jgi:hypothetical protein